MIVDSHVHVASPDTAKFPRQPTGVGSDWWRQGGTVESLVATLDANHVERAVIVQAVGVYGYDCRCAMSAAAANPRRLTFVGAIDMDASDPVADLDMLAGSAMLRGVRLFGVKGEPRWLTDGRADAVCELCAELDIPIVPTLFPSQLGALADLATRHREVGVALDHCGFVDTREPATAVATLAPFTELPSVTLKVTSHLLHAASEAGDPARFVDQLVAAFGAGRVCWGSDFPQHQTLTYAEMLQLAHRAARHLTPPDRERFFAATSARTFRCQ